MGGIGLGCEQPQPNTTHIRTYIHTYAIIHRQTYICTQNDNMQHTEHNTEHSTQNNAHNYRTYSLDYYYEFAYINNSNTIELYTILKD